MSYLPTLLGRPERQVLHRLLYWEFPEKGGQIAIRMGDWKGVRSNMEKDRNAPWELYNLKDDVAEAKNVASQHPDIISQMEAIVKSEHQHAHIREWEFVCPKFSR